MVAQPASRGFGLGLAAGGRGIAGRATRQRHRPNRPQRHIDAGRRRLVACRGPAKGRPFGRLVRRGPCPAGGQQTAQQFGVPSRLAAQRSLSLRRQPAQHGQFPFRAGGRAFQDGNQNQTGADGIQIEVGIGIRQPGQRTGGFGQRRTQLLPGTACSRKIPLFQFDVPQAKQGVVAASAGEKAVGNLLQPQRIAFGHRPFQPGFGQRIDALAVRFQGLRCFLGKRREPPLAELAKRHEADEFSAAMGGLRRQRHQPFAAGVHQSAQRLDRLVPLRVGQVTLDPLQVGTCRVVGFVQLDGRSDGGARRHAGVLSRGRGQAQRPDERERQETTELRQGLASVESDLDAGGITNLVRSPKARGR